MLAYQLAVASDLITASMVEASEFPHLSNKYQVYGVPRTVINENVHVEGAGYVRAQQPLPTLHFFSWSSLHSF